MTDKRQLRRRIRALKSLLGAADREAAAEAVFAAVEGLAEFAAARRVLVYNALPDELPTRGFIDRWAARKLLFLPRVNGDSLELLPYDPERLRPGAFGIGEPDGDDVADPCSMDLIIVPAVAFDACCNRLGRGKGFYDRLLATTRAVTVGVGYDFQLIPEGLPAEPHDIPLDIVVTASRLLRRPSG